MRALAEFCSIVGSAFYCTLKRAVLGRQAVLLANESASPSGCIIANSYSLLENLSYRQWAVLNGRRDSR